MKQLIILFSVAFTLFSCTEKKAIPKKEIHNNMFNWTISIPENFETVSAEQWNKMQQKGKTAVESTYGQEIENNSKTIFVFQSAQSNYFESNWQPFDESVDGNYSNVRQQVSEVMYQTFIQQMPDAKIDSSSADETIDGLSFHAFKMTVTTGNVVMNSYTYSRLFDKKEFTVDILYTDKTNGEAMLDAWKNSTFSGKKGEGK